MADTTATSRQFSLRHIKHETKLNNTLYSMLLDESLVDVILCCESTNLSAHRLILSANSSYFKSLFISLDSNRCQIPVIILKDVPLFDLKAILEFMYKGEVCVEEHRLSSVLKSAELLKVFGLTEVCLALRSRLNNETNVETSAPVVGSGPNKRPRISEGIEQSQQSTQKSFDLISKLSNARFEIRPPLTSSSSNQSNPQQLRSVLGTTITSNTPSLVKNVVLPPSQIFRKTVSTEGLATNRNVFNTETNVQRTETNAHQKSPNFVSLSYGHKSNDSVNTETSTAKSSTKVLSSTWTPSKQKASPVPSSSQINLKTQRPIEVLIDDETNVFVDDSQTDIKPPIFELNQTLNNQKIPLILDIDSDSNSSNKKEIQKEKSPNVRSKIIETSKTDPKSISRLSLKSRNSSTSSQSSLPPPPSYRVVQRSSTRLLRNIIKPTASAASSSTANRKDSSDDRNNSNVKKEKQSVRVFRKIERRMKTDTNSSYEETNPEIECPSCGLKFNDEKKWNQHIRSAHLTQHT